MECMECGAKVVCVSGSCGLESTMICCGKEMKEIKARDSPTDKEA